MSVPSQDTLPASVSKPETSGKNWLLFSIHFQLAVKAKGKWSHFDGTVLRPEAIPADQAEAIVIGGGEDPNDNLVERQLEWDKDKDVALYLLSQRLSDSTLVSVEKYTLYSRKWAVIVHEYTVKSVYAQTVLYTEFLESKLLESKDIYKFINNLHTCKEELSQSRVNVSNVNYYSTIISSLPKYLSTFALS